MTLEDLNEFETSIRMSKELNLRIKHDDVLMLIAEMRKLLEKQPCPTAPTNVSTAS